MQASSGHGPMRKRARTGTPPLCVRIGAKRSGWRDRVNELKVSESKRPTTPCEPRNMCRRSSDGVNNATAYVDHIWQKHASVLRKRALDTL
eukprot:171030-Amphidinium_carterae.2